MANELFPDVIACKVEMFAETMPMFMFKNGIIQSVKVPGDNAARILVDLCHEQDIYRLQLDGNSDYLMAFIQTVREAEELNYANDEHKIEIITKTTALHAEDENENEKEEE